MMIHNLLHSVELLSDSCRSFADNCVAGVEPNLPAIEKHLAQSLMLVTALNPVIGYDKGRYQAVQPPAYGSVSEVAKKAHSEGLTLKEAAVNLGYVSAKEFDALVDPANMICPSL